MKTLKIKKRGIAIVIVLCLAGVILMLGTVYIKSYTNTAPASSLQLDRIQADFFAKGIQNIALFKIKKYPDFFIRSYRKYITGSDGEPFNKFLGTSNSILQNYNNNDFREPLEIATYSTSIKLINSKDFQSEAMEIVVKIKLGKDKAENTYKTVIQGDIKVR